MSCLLVLLDMLYEVLSLFSKLWVRIMKWKLKIKIRGVEVTWFNTIPFTDNGIVMMLMWIWMVFNGTFVLFHIGKLNILSHIEDFRNFDFVCIVIGIIVGIQGIIVGSDLGRRWQKTLKILLFFPFDIYSHCCSIPLKRAHNDQHHLAKVKHHWK